MELCTTGIRRPRAHSIGEMREKLHRLAAAEDVDRVLARLTDSGYSDDHRFAEGYATRDLPVRDW